MNAKLQAVAQEHSDDMAARNYYEHDTPEGVPADAPEPLTAPSRTAVGPWRVASRTYPRPAVQAVSKPDQMLRRRPVSRAARRRSSARARWR
ncbi:hypothetical protein ABZW30_40865 [Kitasatospora sp. NPDC004669]|uniref:CAP domain-containing protein n=1 Tax=Kitasatospora sp. NPDC004669 TaxID=3154555 RepID=UPI0033B69441